MQYSPGSIQRMNTRLILFFILMHFSLFLFITSLLLHLFLLLDQYFTYNKSMAHQQPPRRTTSVAAAAASSSNAPQRSQMIRDLYNTDVNVQTGSFVPMSQPGSPLHLFGTRNTTVSFPSSSVPPSPALSSRSNRAAVTAGVARPMGPIASITQVNDKYQCRTLYAYNVDRMSILPMFPWSDTPIETTSDSPTQATAVALTASGEPFHLLLCNVSSKTFHR